MYEFDGNAFINRAKKALNCNSQKELAEKIHCKESKLSKWKKNETPDIQTVIQIATMGECSIDWLLGLNQNSTEGPRQYKPTIYDFFEMLVLLRQCNLVQFEEGKIVLTKSLFLPSYYNELRDLDRIENVDEELRSKLISLWLDDLKKRHSETPLDVWEYYLPHQNNEEE